MPEQHDHNDESTNSVQRLKRIDDICLKFEAQWRSGDEPKIEIFLEGVDESIRDSLLTLPGDTIVHTGHGDTTVIDDERERVLDRMAELGLS